MQIAQLWRYPVKSLLGERCERVQVVPRGVQADRMYALVDANGRLGSHKNTRRFVRMDHLFDLAGRIVDDQVCVVFPDGSQWVADDVGLAAALSAHVRQPVTLEVEGAVPHHDAGGVHIVTTASMRWLDERVSHSDVRRFRPNLVVDVNGKGLVEDNWIGQTLRCGDVELLVTEPTVRCVMTTTAQQELQQRPEVLRTIAQHACSQFGVYATVVRPGWIRTGDAVHVMR